MIYSVFPNNNATIYESNPLLNTGLNSTISILKTTLGANTFNSRMLFKFDYTDFISVLNSVSSNFSFNTASATCSFNTYTVQKNLSTKTISFDLTDVQPTTWVDSIGKDGYFPAYTGGVNWYTYDGVNNWPAGYTQSYYSATGGGSWNTVYTSSAVTTNGDVHISLTGININTATDFIMKLSNNYESDTNSYAWDFYSTHTHTVYPPRINFYLYDSNVYNTGSLPTTVSSSVLLYMVNLKKEYRRGDLTKFKLACRDRYPAKQFDTNAYANQQYLATSVTGSYSIVDVQTNEYIIPYYPCNTINCNATDGNYFYFLFSPLMSNRYYKIIYKLQYPGGESVEQDNGFIFKVID